MAIPPPRSSRPRLRSSAITRSGVQASPPPRRTTASTTSLVHAQHPLFGYERAADARFKPRPDGWRGWTTVGTVAACGFSGVLYKLVQSPEVLGLMRDVISKAFRLF
jgi:hypothetical protein